MEREWQAAIQAVREAAVLCRRVQHQIGQGVMHKDDRSPVTVADYGSQALICRRLGLLASDPIVAEENAEVLRGLADPGEAPHSGAPADHAALLDRVVLEVRAILPDASPMEICDWIDLGNGQGGPRGRFWTLDPIDGTKGFIRGQQYAVALALIVDGRVEVAAMACPNLGSSPDKEPGEGLIFSAMRGKGAWVEPLEESQAAARSPIHVSATARGDQARFCESVDGGHSDQSRSRRITRHAGVAAAPVRMDSQAKYATVARGWAEAYLRLPVKAGYVEKIWDHAAGALIATEAGGQVSDIDGKGLDFSLGKNLEANRGILVSNGRLHSILLEAIAATPQ